jgi:hypothetical protein
MLPRVALQAEFWVFLLLAPSPIAQCPLALILFFVHHPVLILQRSILIGAARTRCNARWRREGDCSIPASTPTRIPEESCGEPRRLISIADWYLKRPKYLIKYDLLNLE